MAQPTSLAVPRSALSVDEAARTVGVSPKTIRRDISAGRLAAVRIGDRVLIPIRALEAWAGFPILVDRPAEVAGGE